MNMARLDDFLGLMDVTEIRETVSVKVGDRAFDFVVRPITEQEHTEFQRRSQNINRNKVSFDSSKYTDLVLGNCIIEPNFNDDAFLTKVNCVNGVEFLKKKLPAGAIVELSSQIQRLSGFDSYEVEIDNAKN